MAEKKVEIEIKVATYIDGDLAPAGSSHTVAASDARTLFAIGKAVPAGKQVKKPAAEKTAKKA